LGSLKTCARNKSWKRTEEGQLTHIQWKIITEVGLVVMMVVMVGDLFYKVVLLMAALLSRCGHYIFVLFLSFFFLSWFFFAISEPSHNFVGLYLHN